MARYLLPVVLTRAETEGLDVAEAERAVNLAAESGGTAILLPPITFHDVLDVAADGDRMPRKSTLFLPKPASGLALRRVAELHAGHAAGTPDERGQFHLIAAVEPPGPR